MEIGKKEILGRDNVEKVLEVQDETWRQRNIHFTFSIDKKKEAWLRRSFLKDLGRWQKEGLDGTDKDAGTGTCLDRENTGSITP